MGKITVTQCGDIEGLKVVEPTVFGDARGYFMETYNYNDFKEAGIDVEFVQDNKSSSHKGVLRGLHFQINFRAAAPAWWPVRPKTMSPPTPTARTRSAPSTG